VGGSEYYRDPELALNSLWEELESLKIWPQSRWGEQGSSEESSKPEDKQYAFETKEIPKEPKTKEQRMKQGKGIPLREKDLFGKAEKYAKPKYWVSGPLLEKTPKPKNIAEALALKPAILGELIVETLKKRPNYSCVKDALPGFVLNLLGIVSRGKPRERFKRKVFRTLTLLENESRILIYKSVNVRVKLLNPSM
jgi:hypothetical protein